jgi:hypothetical protein
MTLQKRDKNGNPDMKLICETGKGKNMKWSFCIWWLIVFLATGFNAQAVETLNSSAEESTILEYYTTQSIITDPGKYVEIYEGLPDDIPGLVKVVQGVFLHIFWAQEYGVQLTEERASAVNIRTVEGKLAEIQKLDNRPIVEPRELDKRLVANCRDYSILLCSLLRYKGIPARVRCGFGGYFKPGIYMDHWICEYWDATSGQWVRVDAQLDDLQINALGIDFDPLALPEGRFLSGGEAWKLCREGKLDPDTCGFFDPPFLKGMWFIQGDMVRDFMALNKVEILPWDSNNTELMGSPDKEVTESEYTLVDKVAELTTAGDSVFGELRELYESDSDLRMPADWKP